MKRVGMRRGGCGILFVACVWSAACVGAAYAQWPQWGGATRDFSVSGVRLPDEWPESGPRKIWQRPLGDGFSGLIADGDVLYTMYRKGSEPTEITIAIDAKSGQTLWEMEHPSVIPDGAERYPGPHATPLIAGDRLFAIGRNAVLRCFNKKSGELHWELDLVKEYGAKFSQWGYAPSPIGYQGLIILPVSRRRPSFSGEREEEPAVDAKGRTLMAFSQRDGKLAWKSQDLGIGESSPVLFTHEGQDHLALSTPDALFAVDPKTGKLLWTHGSEQTHSAMATPLVFDGDLVFDSNLGTGSELLRLTTRGGEIVPESQWTRRNVRMAFSNPVRVHDFIVGSSGNNPTILVCMDLTTGKRLWVNRSVARSVMLVVDGRLLMLDENGELVLATVDSNDLTIHSRATVAESRCFTAPTLVGNTLYLRDRKNIMAIDVGAVGEPG